MSLQARLPQDPPLTHRLQQVARLSLRHRDRLIRQVSYDFPGSCTALVEDAVSAAIEDALVQVQRPGHSFALAYARDGERGLVLMLRRVAWRKMRGHHRRKASSLERGLDVDWAAESADPETLVVQRERLLDAWLRLDEAAALYAKRDPAPLRAALQDRLQTGDSDACVAKRHGIRRELLTHARLWTRQQIEG